MLTFRVLYRICASSDFSSRLLNLDWSSVLYVFEATPFSPPRLRFTFCFHFASPLVPFRFFNWFFQCPSLLAFCLPLSLVLCSVIHPIHYLCFSSSFQFLTLLHFFYISSLFPFSYQVFSFLLMIFYFFSSDFMFHSLAMSILSFSFPSFSLTSFLLVSS